MLKQIQRFRPNIEPSQTSMDNRFGKTTGEFSFIPEELVPHTVVISLTENATCEILFEYPIEEVLDSIKSLEMYIKYIPGKYTGKINKIIITCSSAKDLITRTGVAAELLKTRKYMLSKESHKKNYDLVSDILERLAVDFSRDSQLPLIFR